MCRYSIYSVYNSMYRTVQCIMYVLCIIVYISVCQLCDVWLNEARHIWHIDRVTEQWQNLEQVSIWFSASVPDHKAICYLLLSHAILYLCAFSVSSFLLCCCEGSVLSLWGFLFSGAVMFGVVSGDSVILFRLYYCVSYYLIFIIYYYL